jgi:mannose-6-phosphate isomerase
MREVALYPLRLDPIYQYRLWGGRRLGHLLSGPFPDDGPIGEAWLLSDRDEHPSRIAEGPLKRSTIGQLMQRSPEQLMGKLAGRFTRFPLLLKFLDVRSRLSVQVHPSDAHKEFIPPGDTGKTEAWVVLEAGPGARIYAGLKPGADPAVIHQAIAGASLPAQLASFAPKLGDAVLVRAGTVHSLSNVVVFEAQENSDVTFRLYDWGHLDPKTGKGRPLQVQQAIACIDFKQGAIEPVTALIEETTPVLREKLVHSDRFDVTRISGQVPCVVGATGMPRAMVCLAGGGELEYAGSRYSFQKGDALLLPAVVGACSCQPHGAMTLLDISLPEVS